MYIINLYWRDLRWILSWFHCRCWLFTSNDQVFKLFHLKKEFLKFHQVSNKFFLQLSFSLDLFRHSFILCVFNHKNVWPFLLFTHLFTIPIHNNTTHLIIFRRTRLWPWLFAIISPSRILWRLFNCDYDFNCKVATKSVFLSLTIQQSSAVQRIS